MTNSTAETTVERQMVPDYLFGCRGICTYCGDTANSIDHVIPVSYFDGKIVRSGSMNGRGVRTYSCTDCNSNLSNKYFESFHDRCEYVNKRIAQRNRKILNLPVWSEEDFEELGKNIKARLAGKLNFKALVLERLRWQSTNEFNEYRQEAQDYFNSKTKIISKEWMREYFSVVKTIQSN